MFSRTNGTTNAIICGDGVNGPAGTLTCRQFILTGETFQSVMPSDSGGIGDMSITQADGWTVMYWTRHADNGNSSHAQIALTGRSNLVWAVGQDNLYAALPLPNMYWFSADLTVQPSPSPSPTPSATPSPSVSVLPGPFTYRLTLAPTLTLQWTQNGSVYNYKAVSTGLNWFAVGTAGTVNGATDMLACSVSMSSAVQYDLDEPEEEEEVNPEVVWSLCYATATTVVMEWTLHVNFSDPTSYYTRYSMSNIVWVLGASQSFDKTGAAQTGVTVNTNAPVSPSTCDVALDGGLHLRTVLSGNVLEVHGTLKGVQTWCVCACMCARVCM